MKAFILSAGLGNRLLPHTLKTPKPCMPLLNIPLIAFNLQHLLNIGVTNFIFNTHHLHQKVSEVITQLLSKKNVTYCFSHEEVLLDSAGGLKNISQILKNEDTFLMLNADSLCLGSSSFLTESIHFHKKEKALATLLCCPSPDPKFQTIMVNKNKHITNIGEISATNLHYMGYMVISSQIFPLIKKKNAHIFTDVLLPYIQKNLNQAAPHQGKVLANYTSFWKFFEMGNLADFNSAEKECNDILKNKTDPDFKAYLNKVINNFQHR